MHILKQRVEDAWEKSVKLREDMDEKLWGSCKTQNGVQLKCVNEYIPGEENANMEVISETVSCVRNEDSMGKKVNTKRCGFVIAACCIDGFHKF